MPPWIGPLTIALTFVWLAAATWRKWPDVLVDFGQQLYIPWRLAGGEHLYTDVALLHGPFSQLFNAVWFRAFGASLTVIVIVNLTILAAIVAMIYALVRQIAGELTASVTALVFVLVFAFAQYTGTGNYDYVTPYVHEATHGIAFGLGLLLCFARYLKSGSRKALAGAGVCLGCALLTKVDLAIAALATSVAGVAIVLWLSRHDAARRPADLWTFAAGAIAPIAMVFTYLLTYLPAGAALRDTFGAFASVSGGVASNAFYARTLGVDDLGGNVALMIEMFLVIAAAAGVAVAIDVALARRVDRPWRIGAVLGVIAFAILIAWPAVSPWRDLPRALPLTTLAVLSGVAAALSQSRDLDAARGSIVPMLLWTVFAIVLLAKIFFNAHLELFGFYLAMPASLVLAVALVYWMPRWLRVRWGGGAIFRALAIGVLAALVVYQVRWSLEVYSAKDYTLGKGGDAIVTYSPNISSPNLVTAEALRWIDANLPPQATFVAMPEGIMLNYLTRHATTMPVINLMMTEMIAFGESSMVASLDRHPPDYVLLVDKNTSEFGVGEFGSDPNYGEHIMHWVDAHYDTVTVLGNEPLRGRGFGIKIMKHTH